MREIEGDDSPNYGHVFQTVIAWKRNAIDGVLRLVADDRMSNTMLFDPASSWVFHPYDGGMDVICETVNERDRLMCKYDSWCSHRENGL